MFMCIYNELKKKPSVNWAQIGKKMRTTGDPMISLEKESTTQPPFAEIEKLYEEILQLRQENLSLKFDLVTLKHQITCARIEAELESKYAKGLRNYFKGVKS